MADGMALAQGAVERLYEDEALRGDLTDEGAKAVLDWASGALTAAAEGFAQESDEQAQATKMDAAEEAVRRVAKLLVRAAERHQRTDVMALVNDPLVSGSFAARLRLGAAGLRLGDDSDRNAIRLAGALRGVRP
ncbi:MAG: hypothetical protein U0841_32295 [Chloroflexia bacterium]